MSLNLCFYIINFLLLLVMIFIERKKSTVIFAWISIFALFPIGGFVLYVLIGGGLSFITKRRLKKKRFLKSDYTAFEKEFYEKHTLNKQEIHEVEKAKNLINFNLMTSGARLLTKNNIKYYTNGQDKINDLISEMLKKL